MAINPLLLDKKSYLEELPNEILLKILKKDLDIIDLKAVRGLSRRWYALASDRKIWKNVATKVSFVIIPNSKIGFSDVKIFVMSLLREAKEEKKSFFERSFVRQWTIKNVQNDRDITIKKINELREEIRQELIWKVISKNARNNHLYFLFRRHKDFFNKITRINPFIEQLI